MLAVLRVRVKINNFFGPVLTIITILAAITDVSGPNGNIDWLNCGIDQDGWQPPPIHVKDVIAQDLGTALDTSSSPFHACKAYISQFQQYAGEFGGDSLVSSSPS